MSFIGSIMVCFWFGWFDAFLYRKYLRKRNKGWHFYLGCLTLGGMMVLDVLIYTNVFPWPQYLFPWVQLPAGITNFGKYWMFNPGIMWGSQWGNPIYPDELEAHIYMIAMLFCYFVSFREGMNLGRIMYGRLSYERGYWYLIRSTNMIVRSKKKVEKRLQEERSKS
jgi:hypothetical protein